MLQRLRECLLTTSTKNQRKDASEKNADQNKEPSRAVIEDSQSTSIGPESSDYVEAISDKPYVGQVEEIDEQGEEEHINFLEHKDDLKDEVNSISLKKKTKYGFLFLISCVLFQSLQLLKGFLKFAQMYLIMF